MGGVYRDGDVIFNGDEFRIGMCVTGGTEKWDVVMVMMDFEHVHVLLLMPSSSP